MLGIEDVSDSGSRSGGRLPYGPRVGGGPFPTEQENATGQYLRDRGNEYGTVTRRPRRCGWLDLVALRYTAAVNGFTDLAVTKLDVLDTLPEIGIGLGFGGLFVGSYLWFLSRVPLLPSPATLGAREPTLIEVPAGTAVQER